MCFSLNLKCFTFELNCGMLFFQKAGTSNQQSSSTTYKSSGSSLEQYEMPKTVSSSPCSTEDCYNSASISPLVTVLSRTSSTTILSTSSSRDKQIQHALDDSSVALQSAWKKCTYKKLSELLEPETKINIYGVIHTIVKVKLVQNLAYIVCSY